MKRLAAFLLLCSALSLAQMRIPGPGGVPAGCTSASGHVYSTLFPLTESPISECSSWLNGALDGNNLWTNFNSTTNFAFGTEANTSTHFDDSTALVKGTWGNDVMAVGVVVAGATVGAGLDKEIELRLRSTLNSTTNSGYEFQFLGFQSTTSSCTGNIVKWNGAQDSFTPIATGSGGANFCLATGDTIRATSIGSTLTAWVNDRQVATVTDATFGSGSPGMGTYIHAGSVANDFGFSAYRATDNPIVLVQTKAFHTSTSGTSVGTVFSSNTTTGNLIWCTAYWADTARTGSVSDVANGTYTAVDSPVNGAGGLSTYRAQTFYKANITGATTPTITLTMSGSAGAVDRAIACHEVRGVSTLDQHPAVKSSSGSTMTSNTTGTTTANDEYAAGFCVLAGGFSQLNNTDIWYQRLSATFGTNVTGDRYISKPQTVQFSAAQSSGNYLCGINTFN